MRGQMSMRALSLAYYRKQILEAIGKDTIVCLECGRRYQALPNHLRLTHDLPVEEYKARWGYNRSTGLYCRALAEHFRARAEALGLGQDGTPEQARQASEAQQGGYTLRTEATLHRQASPVVQAASRQRQKLSDDELIRLALQGLPSVEITQRTGIHPRHVRARLAKLRARGIRLPRPQPRWNPPNRKVSDEAILAGLAQALTHQAIAERVGVSRKAITARVAQLRAKGLLASARRSPTEKAS